MGGDASAVMACLERYSRERGWLKFGAEGRKGSVIDEALDSLPANATVLEFGTFLGYSAMRIAKRLGHGCRIITVESDPEVACLAENLLVHAAVDNCVQVC